MPSRYALCCLLCAFLLATAARATPARADECTVPAGGATLPWHEIGGSKALHLSLLIEGATTPSVVEVDTGSVGIALAQHKYDGPLGNSLGPGQIFYSSSGLKFTGSYYSRTLLIGERGEACVGTDAVPVLLIDKVTCTYSTCPYGSETLRKGETRTGADVGISMMGVGFGRQQGTPKENPFVNLSGLPAGLSQGYVIGGEEVVLGVSAASESGFSVVALSPTTSEDPITHAQVADFQSPGAALKITNPKAGCSYVPAADAPVPLLVDSGIDEMIVTSPESDRAPACIAVGAGGHFAPGLNFTITLAGATAPAATYSGGSDGTAASDPAYIRWGLSGDAHAVNTGRNLLVGGGKVLFNAGKGRYGLQVPSAKAN